MKVKIFEGNFSTDGDREEFLKFEEEINEWLKTDIEVIKIKQSSSRLGDEGRNERYHSCIISVWYKD